MTTRDRTVVLVDDDEMILDRGGRAFQSLGCRFHMVPSCDLAYRIAEETGDKIDLVILDYLESTSNGKRVLKRFKDMNGGLKILLTGGRCEFAPASGLLKEQGIDFIRKPFTAAELRDKVYSMLP